MPKSSYKEKERERREQEILDKARQMLMERGYNALNMDDLAEAVGISKPTLYQHFKSKDDIVAQVVADWYGSFEALMEQSLGKSPLGQLLDNMRWTIERRYRPDSIFAMLDHESAWHALRKHPVLAEKRKLAHAKLQQLVEDAKAAGELDPTIQTALIVRAMFSLQWVLTDMEQPFPHPQTPEQIEAGIQSVIHIFLNGVGAKPTSTGESKRYQSE